MVVNGSMNKLNPSHGSSVSARGMGDNNFPTLKTLSHSTELVSAKILPYVISCLSQFTF